MSTQELVDAGCAYLERKDYRAAEDVFRRALDAHPSPPAEIQFRLAFCLEMQGAYADAESLYLQAAAADAPSALGGDALFRIAWMAQIVKDHPKAITYFQKASEVLQCAAGSGQLAECLYRLALSHEAVGRIIKALAVYQRIENDTLWFWEVCYRKINCFDKIGRYGEALACCLEYEARYVSAPAGKRAQELYPGIKRMRQQLEQLLSGCD